MNYFRVVTGRKYAGVIATPAPRIATGRFTISRFRSLPALLLFVLSALSQADAKMPKSADGAKSGPSAELPAQTPVAPGKSRSNLSTEVQAALQWEEEAMRHGRFVCTNPNPNPNPNPNLITITSSRRS